MSMRKDELMALYRRHFGKSGDWSDTEWAAGCLGAVRKCVEARSLDEAAELLRREGWVKPVECAMRLRGLKEQPPCPHCGGTGRLTL